MRKKYLLPLLLAVSLLAPALPAQTLAFTPNGDGVRQDYHYSLGLFFTLSAPLTISSAGYWDDNLDGVTSSLTVAIFDLNTVPAIIPGTALTFNGTNGVLVGTLIADQTNFGGGSSGRPGQFRMADFLIPIILPAGQYALVAWGFDFNNQMINGANIGPAVAVDPFGGILTFDEARYGNSAGTLPTVFDSNYAQYASATFSPNAVGAAVPEPSAYALTMGVAGLAGAWCLRQRARRLNSTLPLDANLV
jgi:hypothetical protein